MLPPMYGRDEAGHNSTMATHHALAASTASPNQAIWTIRRPIPGLAHQRYTRAKAGSTMKASSVLSRNAKPTRAPESTRRLVRAVSSADHNAQAASSSSRVNNASGLL